MWCLLSEPWKLDIFHQKCANLCHLPYKGIHSPPNCDKISTLASPRHCHKTGEHTKSHNNRQTHCNSYKNWKIATTKGKHTEALIVTRTCKHAKHHNNRWDHQTPPKAYLSLQKENKPDVTWTGEHTTTVPTTCQHTTLFITTLSLQQSNTRENGEKIYFQIFAIHLFGKNLKQQFNFKFYLEVSSKKIC